MKRSSIRLQYNAPVTLTFFFLSLASLVLGYLTNNWTTSHLFSVYRSSMTDPLFYVRLFGHVLGHGGWDHFINQYAPLPCCRSTFGRTIWKPNTSKRYPYDRAGIRHNAVCAVPHFCIAWCIRYRIHAHHALQFGRQ